MYLVRARLCSRTTRIDFQEASPSEALEAPPALAAPLCGRRDSIQGGCQILPRRRPLGLESCQSPFLVQFWCQNSEQDSCIILRPRNRQLMKKQIICHAYTFSNMAIGLGANGTRSHPVFRFVSLSFWPTTSSKMFKDDYKKGTIKDYRSLISIWIPMTRDVASRFLSVHKIKILPQIHPFLPTNHNHHHRYQHNFLQLQLSDGKLPTYVF